MKKALILVLVAILAAASIIFGSTNRPVLACISGYLGVTLLFLTVWHYSRKSRNEFEVRSGLGSHGCYEQPED